MDRLVGTEHENERIVLGLLSSVEIDGGRSQRRIAAELGIALGLVNAYLRRCVKKGLVKVHDAPARRYAYYLTPKGFAEKSRLTVEYLSESFAFFRRAKADCADVFALAKERNFQDLILYGKSDLAEIAILSAVDCGITIVAVIDAAISATHFVGKPVVATIADLSRPFDAVMITELKDARRVLDEVVQLFGPDRVFVPGLLGLLTPEQRREAQ
jgi:DNA-binding MarR family transcriptional regulator